MATGSFSNIPGAFIANIFTH